MKYLRKIWKKYLTKQSHYQRKKIKKIIVIDKLDSYEDFPSLYKKIYFKYYGKKVMTYSMVRKTLFRYPTERYLNTIILPKFSKHIRK